MLVWFGDIFVGKVLFKLKIELILEEKFLYVIFGWVGEDVKNDFLEVLFGIEGIIIDI